VTHELDNIDLTVFSLVCGNCDGGDDQHNQVDAAAAGWTEIEFQTDPPPAIFLGLCPDCRRGRELAEQFEARRSKPRRRRMPDARFGRVPGKRASSW
jgi:hypothetical protein